MNPTPFSILRETASYLVVAKPAGMASIPEAAGDKECLQARLEAMTDGKIWVVHRLDKEVSGIILFARTAEAHRFLNLAFERREVAKIYAAGAHGVIRENAGEIALPLREFGSGRIGVDAEKGKPCLTRWRVRERRADRTLLDMEPHTGRRHQLRAHAYAIGHPLIGDTRYGDRSAQSRWPRLLLHARSLDFPTPEGGRATVDFSPENDFLSAWDMPAAPAAQR